MVSDLNRCEFIGRLGAEPVARFSRNGVAITTFSLGVNKSWKNTSSGQQEKQTQWVRIVAFRRLAEICAEYLHKGSRVFIAGEFQSRSWEDDGNTRHITEVVARQMLMLDAKKTAGDYSQHKTWGQTHPGYSSGKADDDIPP